MKKIEEIAQKLNLKEENIEKYGNYKAKINYQNENLKGKLILVTSVSPTPYGEGKTTMSLGLNDAFRKLNKNSVAVLREPSLGPVFGIKGGATGGGMAKVVPENDINLHFTGDMHAITSANNLLSAAIDNHIYQGNELKIKKVLFNRCLDINDRALRKINLENREESFDLTPASEIMAILCLAQNLEDLKEKIGNIIIGENIEGNPVYAKELKIENAMTILLKDAIKPNLVQSLENNPIIIHGGPFANIAHGCNSAVATKLALSLSDYVITEAGFGSDLGAVKFFDIKCRLNNLKPYAVVINVTIRSLKYNGEGDLLKGLENLKFHILNMQKFINNIIVCLNHFKEDTLEEIEIIKNYTLKFNVETIISYAYEKGGEGSTELALKICEFKKPKINTLYDLNEPLKEKISKILSLYYPSKIVYEEKALEKIKKYNNLPLPICICKTPFSISDDPKKLGFPKDNTLTVTDIKLKNGAGFITVYLGKVLTMPGLPKEPAYLNMQIDGEGNITGIN